MTPEEQEFCRTALPPMRDPITGLYPANPARPRRKIRGRYNFAAIVADFIEAHGGFVEDVLIDIFQSMWKAAKEGDVAAARLLLERFSGKDADLLEVTVNTSQLTEVERVQRLQAIFANAALRAAESREQGRNRITINPN